MGILFFFKQMAKGHQGVFSNIFNFKYYKRWRSYLKVGKSSISDRLPWITFPAIDFLKKNLKPEFKIFEYGGGGSTLFFLDRVKEVVTIEHNEEWFNILQKNINTDISRKWNGNFILPESNNIQHSLSISNPDHYFSDDSGFSTMTFKNYVSYIDQFADKYFDVVLIDGRARTSCLKHAVSKIKKGGFLVIDNTERNYYLENTTSYLKDFKLIVSKFAPQPYNAIFTQTSIWTKVN